MLIYYKKRLQAEPGGGVQSLALKSVFLLYYIFEKRNEKDQGSESPGSRIAETNPEKRGGGRRGIYRSAVYNYGQEHADERSCGEFRYARA